jgi:hypothetical protein
MNRAGMGMIERERKFDRESVGGTKKPLKEMGIENR